MSEPGRRLTAGRASELFDLGDGTVLRRNRLGHDTTGEARVMRWLREQGVPVPAVHVADGPDLVMDLVEGPTLLDDLVAHPSRVFRHARTLAELQRRLNGVAAPPWFPQRPGVAPGSQVLHLDLHPMNVLLGHDGPVLVDWTNASRGEPGFDAATSFVILDGADLDGHRDRLGRDLFTRAFARRRGRRMIRQHLSAAAHLRLSDPNLTEGERRRLLRTRPRPHS